jgi:hypothetical protein
MDYLRISTALTLSAATATSCSQVDELERRSADTFDRPAPETTDPATSATGSPSAAPLLAKPTPFDLMTDASTTMPTLTFDGKVESPEAIAARLTLLRWPSGPSVDAERGVREFPSDGAVITEVEVRPPELLGEGWYAMVIETPLPGAAVRASDGFEMADGRVAVRFRVGMEPVLRRVMFCPVSQTGETDVVVAFSENIVLPAPPTEMVSVEQSAAVQCEGRPELAWGTDAPSLWVTRCSNLDVTSSVMVRTPPDLVNRAGVRLRMYGDGPVEVNAVPNQLPLGGDQSRCSVHVP